MSGIDNNLLPNFLIIGAAKCGTTTLFGIARQHPAIYTPTDIKELNFFSVEARYQKGLAWYQETYFGGARGYPARGEASPTYMARSGLTAGRIRAAYEGKPLRLIAILRNPVDRAYSEYWHWIRNKKENLSFEEAVRAERDWLEAHPDVQVLPAGQRHYLYQGAYTARLKPFLDCFPREDFLFLLLDDVINDYASAAASFYRFLGQDPEFPVSKEPKNMAWQPRSELLHESLLQPKAPIRRVATFFMKLFPQEARKQWKKRIKQLNRKQAQNPPMQDAIRKELTDYYRDEVQSLEGLLGRDLSHWTR